MIWLGWVLWHINHYTLFNVKSSLCLDIKYIWFGWIGFLGTSTNVVYLMPNPLYTYILDIYDLVGLGFLALTYGVKCICTHIKTTQCPWKNIYVYICIRESSFVHTYVYTRISALKNIYVYICIVAREAQGYPCYQLDMMMRRIYMH